MGRSIHLLRAASVIAALGLLVGQSDAQADYPVRAITMIVPFPAGGPTDTIARVTAEAMSRFLGQTIVIENVAGAGGTLGAARVARATPDGYTLLVHHLGLSTAPALYRNLPYDTKTAFAPVGLVTNAPMTIVGRSDLEPDSLAELMAFVKARGEKITFANAGVGSASHLCGLLFMTAIQRQLTAVPYKGGAPLMNDLLGRQIDMACDQATTSTGPIRAKRVKAYAVTTMRRLNTLPDLPTADEAGLKGFEVGVWHGIYAPKETSPATVQRLAAALKAALNDRDLARRFRDISTEPATDGEATPDALRRRLLSEIDRWGPIIKASGQFAD